MRLGGSPFSEFPIKVHDQVTIEKPKVESTSQQARGVLLPHPRVTPLHHKQSNLKAPVPHARLKFKPIAHAEPKGKHQLFFWGLELLPEGTENSCQRALHYQQHWDGTLGPVHPTPPTSNPSHVHFQEHK